MWARFGIVAFVALIGAGCCPIDWSPSALRPVFYGVRDYGTADGAPGSCRVFYPSIDGAVFDAPMLTQCGPYPLIVFVHGNCGDSDHYREWYTLPAELARSGFVVAVPEFPGISDGSAYPWNKANTEFDRLQDTIVWMRESWEYRTAVLGAPNTGLVGHSWGALLAGRLAAEGDIAAFASLSGTWGEWGGGPGTLPISAIESPMLFIWGTGAGDTFAPVEGPQWDSLALPKHRAMLSGGAHWDYLSDEDTTCDDESARGPCAGDEKEPREPNRAAALAGDVVTMFFAKYLAATGSGDIPDSLVPPSVDLTTEQRFFAGGHLVGVSLLDGKKECAFTLEWVTEDGEGTATIP